MLTALKTQDPNDNGQADEVPFAGATTGWNTTLDGYLMNPYGAPAEMVLPPLFVALTDQQEFNELRTTINEFVRENVALFVTGKLDPETDWDAYLAEDKIGIDATGNWCRAPATATTGKRSRERSKP